MRGVGRAASRYVEKQSGFDPDYQPALVGTGRVAPSRLSPDCPGGHQYLPPMDMDPEDIARAISESGMSIYDSLRDRPDLYFPLAGIEIRLDGELKGLDLDQPIRTRSKVAKTKVAEALGYEAPKSFKKEQPRFPGQNLDIYVQKADNLQIWNEEIDATRRYALIRVSDDGEVTAVRVLTGEEIALLDRTGTLTAKYQASRRAGREGSVLVSASDTDLMRRELEPGPVDSGRLRSLAPTDPPKRGRCLEIGEVYERLLPLVGREIEDPGAVQDRNRGVAMQREVCELLELGEYADGGQFPDVLCQAFEVKFQTSRTIDLGLVSPDSTEPAESLGHGLRHCDARYAVVYGEATRPGIVTVRSVVVATGADFFSEFQRFEGNVQNRKLQIPLPRDLFDTKRTQDE